LKSLKENPKNPRTLSKEHGKHLEESLSKFGQCEPVVINQDGLIIGGHQRVRSLKKLGYKTVDVYVPDRILDEKEVEELSIRLNKNTGEWDWEILGNEWEVEDLLKWGFTPEELQIETIDSIDPDEDKKKSVSMHITFLKEEDLQEAENTISEIVDRYQGAKYKIKI